MQENPSPITQDTLRRPPRLSHYLTPRQAIVTLALVAGVVACSAVVFLYYLTTLLESTPVTVIDGGEMRTVDTYAETVGELLTQLDANPRQGDQISADISAALAPDMVIEVQRARRITLDVDGETRTLQTTLTNPVTILAAEGIRLQPNDRVLLDGTQTTHDALADWPVPVNQIRIQRAVSVTVQDGDAQVTVRTAGETVGDALHAAGVQLYLADSVSPSLDAPLTDNMTITIGRSQPATIEIDGERLETRTRGETVGDLLAETGIALTGLDYTIPNESAPVRPGMTVRVMRVTEEVISQTTTIPHSSQNNADPTLELDQIRLVQSGQDGLQRTDVRVRYENGVEVSREELEPVIVQQPQDRIVTYGTGVVLRPIETEQGTRQYWRKVRVYATSYHPAALGGDDITATGQRLTKGIVGIDPDLFPYGTELYIPGYGIGVAADTGPDRGFSRWIDLGYDDENYEPWSQYVDVYVLAPVPDNIQYVIPE